MPMDSMISPEILNEPRGGTVVIVTMASTERRKICLKFAFKGA